MREPLPLTGDDLRAIADAVDEVEATELAGNPLIGRVEVYRPDTDERVGWASRFDDGDPEMGWGFTMREDET